MVYRHEGCLLRQRRRYRGRRVHDHTPGEGAAEGGHEVWYVGVADIEHGECDGRLSARAHAAEFEKGDTLERFSKRIKDGDAQRIDVGALDALFLRNESIDDLQERPWASPLGLVFGQMIKARGVTVVNDPMSLIRATSKLYLEEFPENIRPRSLVTRDPEAIGAVRRQGRPLRPQAAVRSQRTERVHDRE
jgi:glutathione synthase